MDLSPKHRRELQSAGVKVILATGQAPSLKRPMNSISDVRASAFPSRVRKPEKTTYD